MNEPNKAAAIRRCPGCRSVMGRVFAKAVELDFCQFCGGLWFDRGEVFELTGLNEALPPEGLKQNLACPDCRTAMQRGQLRDCVVHRCAACAGTYVPPDTLQRLAGEQVKLLPMPASSQQNEVLEIKCPGCHERIPMEQAVSSGGAMACRNCASTAGFAWPASESSAPLMLSAAFSDEADPGPELDGPAYLIGMLLQVL